MRWLLMALVIIAMLVVIAVNTFVLLPLIPSIWLRIAISFFCGPGVGYIAGWLLYSIYHWEY